MATAFGRSIADLPNLNETERLIVQAARTGDYADCKTSSLETDDVVETVRGALVRFLALGGDDQTPVHERGVRIYGAVIRGPLDLEGCTVSIDLVLSDCLILDTITLQGANLRTINLEGSRFRDIHADRADISGSLLLRNCTAEGTVRLVSARIRDSLDCAGATFKGKAFSEDDEPKSMICDRSEIGSDVSLCRFVSKGKGRKSIRRNFRAEAAVHFTQATINGSFDCKGGHFLGVNRGDQSLICDRAKIGGDVQFRRGFYAVGAVSLIRAEISGDLSCVGGYFGGREAAIQLGRSSVLGTCWFAASRQRKEITRYCGGVDLSDARLNRIVDATTETSRRRTGDETGSEPAHLALDGLSYARFQDTNLSVATRLAFLNLQKPERFPAFNPQPWVQMIGVLRDMGYESAARGIAIERQRASRSAGTFTGFRKFFHALYGWFYGYGYRPLLLGAWAFGVAALSALIFSVAAADGLMGPTDARILDDRRYAACGPGAFYSWTECPDLQFRYTTFSPILYSLELAIPIIGARQTKDWTAIVIVPCLETGPFNLCREIATTPDRLSATGQSPGYSRAGLLVTIWTYVANLLGWLAGLMFVAVASGLVRRD